MIANHLPPKTLQMKCSLENIFQHWLQVQTPDNSSIFKRFYGIFSTPATPEETAHLRSAKTLSWRISSAQGSRIITKPGGLSCSPSSSTSAFWRPRRLCFVFFLQIRWVEKNPRLKHLCGIFFDAWKSLAPGFVWNGNNGMSEWTMWYKVQKTSIKRAQWVLGWSNMGFPFHGL